MDRIYKRIYGEHDILKGDTPTEQRHSSGLPNPNIPAETISGFERIKLKLFPDEYGELSDEVHTIVEVSFLSMFIGCVYGGVTHSRVGYLEFFENNQATVFKDHIDAKKKLQEKVTKSFAKGAFKWGWRLTLFSTSYFALSTAISVYRDKNGILEHVVAGGLAGGSYKFNMGPKGWLVGCGLGSTLGLCAGIITTGLMALTGTNMKVVRENNKRINDLRFSPAVKEGLETYFNTDETGVNEAYKRRLELDQALLSLDDDNNNKS